MKILAINGSARKDSIILASPVYSGNVSANLQAILERIGVVCDMNK